jgi:3-oxoacyl-[acyl-carrier-protein] synthase-1/3-oxoacyl-[acyl-carrier-protein] synthase II
VQAVLGRAPERLVSLYGACASSALALGLGARWLELGRCELVIAGGYDAESDWVGAGFDSLKATSSAPPRSFRHERDGMALGEGAAVLALERVSTRAYGFIAGFGATTDAVHITAPDRTGSGLARAAKLALGDAGLASDDVPCVSVHGTGTPYNDASEAAALREVFGARAGELWLHAFKPSLGHTLGAASALESLAALSALERGLWPASAGTGSPMPELPARLLERSEPAGFEHCLKLATAFGGANAALVLSRSPGAPQKRAERPVHMAAIGPVCRELELSRAMPQLVAAPERLPRSDTLSSLAIAAASEVLGHARIERLRTGVVVGTVGATLEADAAFGERILARGVEQAEPRRFPATSPNACPGHVAIAFGLGGPSHAVGAGADAAFEAVRVACDWVAAGDADAMLVIAVEQVGETSQRALAPHGVTELEQGALALLVTAAEQGPALDEALIERAAELPGARNTGFSRLRAIAIAAGLPGSGGFGSVRPPE